MNLRLSWIFMAIAAAAATIGPAHAAAAKPARIVSLNLCADQLLIALAERRNIASVTYFAAKPEYSPNAGQARGLAVNYGQAEEIIPLKPDLVFAGRFSARATVGILRKLGYPVVEIPVVHSMQDVRRNVRLVARAIGERARGEAMIASFDGRLKAIARGQSAIRPIAAIYWVRGNTAGVGTLMGAIVEQAGFVNLARRLGISGTANLPLETLLSSPAEALVLASTSGDPPSLAAEAVTHPALARLIRTRPSVAMSSQLWSCGTPSLVDAIARLAALRRQVIARRR
jgi:iron complex transport system substrate-binding protein